MKSSRTARSQVGRSTDGGVSAGITAPNKHFTKDVRPLISTVSELARQDGDELEQAVLQQANAKLEEPEYDNWDGGSYYYTLTLTVPVPLFARLGDGTSSLEQRIAKRRRDERAERRAPGRTTSEAAANVPRDTHRNLQVDAHYSDQRFKHILVPVWLLTYTYGAKVYQVVANGVTGHMAGDRPWSWVKIMLLVIVVLIVLYLSQSS